MADYLRDTDGRPLKKGERDYLAHAMMRCQETADAILYRTTHSEMDPADRNLGFQAERLAQEIADRVEGAA